ncbi:MAG: hypothetical protein ABJA57_09740 [Ginsengibacter sp.]
MKKIAFRVLILALVISGVLTISSCQKNMDPLSASLEQATLNAPVDKAPTPATPNFNLEVILKGPGDAFGLVKFRQNNDLAKIVTLDVWVRNLEPNHEYKLQRAVDANVNGDCTSTAWLTLGKGLVPQSIFTDENGTGREQLSRNLSAVASGTPFDIHFQVIDAVTSAVVLTSNCYQFTVR